ncbi:hypothetical protein [Chryseobacterium polytrichastri]|uniref:Uncharacterized protein n=1 Tax=Chryseobacterium polytrichastri TaxID=1302687 RepID=A0A1M6TAJ6_9FLAO|nr:hypothetical protein [Chryseobacterium polytrichastri]SHK54082.1 hypothetical protein SAMN05444267_100536 [Chryseobacterium polytrichastri]
MKNHKIHIKQTDNQFPTDKEIRMSLRKLGLRDVVFSILKTIEFAELSERDLKTVITSKTQNSLEELLKNQLLNPPISNHRIDSLFDTSNFKQKDCQPFK